MYRPSPYEGLQTLFAEGKNLSDKERLAFSYGPLLSWYREHKRALPWRENKDAYRIWISEIMLQQTRVEAVKPYFFRFMEHFPTVEALANAPDEELLKCWEGLGYYSRARNLKKAAGVIMEQHGGKLPASKEELLALPGIGSYTAGAIASIAYEIAAPAVDGNVLRVLSRVTGSYDDILKQSTKKKMENLVSEVIKSGEAGDFNQALIEIGAIVCVPNGAPLCDSCPFYTVCAAREKGLIDEIPVKTPKKKRRIEEKTVLLLQYGEKIAIRKRSAEGLLASLYEFVNVPGKLGEDEVEAMFEKPVTMEPLPDAKHIFSHVEWHMGGYLVSVSEVPKALENEGGEPMIFVTWEELREKYPIPAAFIAYKNFLDKLYEEN
ncbi:MAG: A/G-specific adenine glycosylase [Lachnospiraceae bacterium]|nr:A/G-specific adenine glycosylase [Lachnospiraceae bacterium]